MKTTFKNFSVYGIAYLVLLAIVLGMLYALPKSELHLIMNAYHTPSEDTFFKYYSTMAEWPLYVLALLPVFWKQIQMTVLFILSELTSGALLQILKHLFSFERPISFFEHHDHMLLPLVQGVDMHHSNSFPSGHASTFFVFFTCCALILAYHYQKNSSGLILRKRYMVVLWMLVLFTMAALGAYSRVYLSQHFLSDVCVGSIIGFVTPCLYFFFARKWIIKLCNQIYHIQR